MTGLDGVVAKLYGRPEVSVKEISGIEYGSGSEDPPVYPAGWAFRWPVGPLGAAIQPEMNSSTATAISERAEMAIRAMPAGLIAEEAVPDRSVPIRRGRLTSRLTPAIAVKFPILLD